ncbi:MAG: glutamate--tRNA ligase family protein, partial [Candidatus Micrarchaeota archaeon]
SENFTSDKMPQLYKFAEKMIILGRAYVCTCGKEEINKKRFGKIGCACRARHGGENFRMWEEMIAGKVKKGERILRLKADMQSENTVMRDPTLFRLMDSSHYRQGMKYVCWPTYDFEVSLSDSIDGITHALRSKEYELRDELYYAILSAVHMRKPLVYDFSRLNMKGTLLSKRLIKPLIEKKQVEGWDDPRLATLMGLRRRGILPDAIKEFVLRQGLSKAETEPEFRDLLAINRKLLNASSPHHVFVPEPVKLSLKNMGGKGEFYIPRDDAAKFKPKEHVGLIRNLAIEILEKKKTSVTASAIKTEKMPEKKIQWLPASEGSSIKCEIMEIGDLLNGKGTVNKDGIQIRKGLCGKDCASLNAGDIVQFDRYGFCKLDAKEKEKLVFILSC